MAYAKTDPYDDMELNVNSSKEEEPERQSMSEEKAGVVGVNKSMKRRNFRKIAMYVIIPVVVVVGFVFAGLAYWGHHGGGDNGILVPAACLSGRARCTKNQIDYVYACNTTLSLSVLCDFTDVCVPDKIITCRNYSHCEQDVISTTRPHFVCKCNAGYELANNTNCVAYDTCQRQANLCTSPKSVCRSTFPGHYCSCTNNYIGRAGNCESVFTVLSRLNEMDDCNATEFLNVKNSWSANGTIRDAKCDVCNEADFFGVSAQLYNMRVGYCNVTGIQTRTCLGDEVVIYNFDTKQFQCESCSAGTFPDASGKYCVE